MTMQTDIRLLMNTTEYNWDAIEALSRLSGLDIDSAGGLLSKLVDDDSGIVKWLIGENFVLASQWHM